MFCSYFVRPDETPSRFVIKDTETDWYREVDTDYAREKVSHALRSRLSCQKKSKKRSLKNTDSLSPAKRQHRQTTRRIIRHCSEWSNEEEKQIQRLIREQQDLLQTFLRR